MASGEIFRISDSTPKGLLTLALSFTHDDYQPDSIMFRLTVELGTDAGHVDATASLVDESVSVSAAMTSKISLCLLGCAGKGLVKPLFECYSKSIPDYIKCLRGKGLSIAGEIAACAIGCLSAP